MWDYLISQGLPWSFKETLQQTGGQITPFALGLGWILWICIWSGRIGTRRIPVSKTWFWSISLKQDDAKLGGTQAFWPVWTTPNLLFSLFPFLLL